MSSALPQLLDPVRAADAALQLGGRLPLSGFARLRSALQDPIGEAAFQLSFGRDQDGRATISGNVKATLVLCCQRCLGPLVHEVDERISLAVVNGMDEARDLPVRYDPLLATDALVRLADLVEDELLLSLPQISVHEPGVCEAADSGTVVEVTADRESSDRESPFAVLAGWKRG